MKENYKGEVCKITGIDLPLPDDLDERMVLAGTVILHWTKDRIPVTDRKDIADLIKIGYTYYIANSDGTFLVDDNFNEAVFVWFNSTVHAYRFMTTLIGTGVIRLEEEGLFGPESKIILV